MSAGLQDLVGRPAHRERGRPPRRRAALPPPAGGNGRVGDLLQACQDPERMGPCLGPREHLLRHATFCISRSLDDHPAAVEDRVGHVALRARPSRAPAVDATAVAPISSRKPRVAPSPCSSTSLLEADQALARDADEGVGLFPPENVDISPPSPRLPPGLLSQDCFRKSQPDSLFFLLRGGFCLSHFLASPLSQAILKLVQSRLRCVGAFQSPSFLLPRHLLALTSLPNRKPHAKQS